METYTAMRHFADSWGLLAMTLFFAGVVVFTLRPGSKKLRTTPPAFRLRRTRICPKTH